MNLFKSSLALVLSIALLVSFVAIVPAVKADAADADDIVITVLEPRGDSDGAYLDIERPYVPAQNEKYSPKSASVPASYDLRNVDDNNYVTPIRNQNPYGACWAFAACAAAESGLLKQNSTAYTSSAKIMSPLHLVDFSYNNAYDKLGLLSGDSTIAPSEKLNLGGNHFVSGFSLSRWTGFANENGRGGNFLYSNAKDDINYSIDPQYAYNSNTNIVKDIYWVDVDQTSNVKSMLMTYGAAVVGFYYSNSYLNSTTNAYYYNGTSGTNHAVTLIGWDDNYAATNFKEGCRPTSNGAWIIKNSYGSTWGNSGCFYLSYEDTSLLGTDAAFYVLDSADKYDNNYQYDGTMAVAQMGESNDYWGRTGGGYMANIYTPDSAETLKGVSFFTWEPSVNYTIEVYKNLANTTNPKSGTLATTVNGTATNRGYHTVDIPDVALAANQKFSTVVRLYKGASDIVTLFCDFSYTDGYGTIYTNSSSAGQSFFCSAANAGTSWKDIGTAYNASFRLKAFTTENVPSTDTETDTLTDIDITDTEEATLYDVKYFGNGGLTVNGESEYYDRKYAQGDIVYLKHELFTRTGYTYTGVKVGTTMIAKTYGGMYMPGFNMNLYAQWEPNTDTPYSVEHYVMNTSGDYPVSATKTDSLNGTTATSLTLSELADSTLIVENGVTFDHAEVTAGVAANTAVIKADGSLVVKLYYTRHQYALTLNAGTGISGVTGAGNYYYDANVTANATVKPGYSWAGWTGDRNSAESALNFSMPASNLELTANATANTYTLTVNPNGGTFDSKRENSVYNVNCDAEVNISVPTRIGYSFSGWAITGTGSSMTSLTEAATFTMGSENATLTASWTSNQYSVTILPNGGMWNSVSSNSTLTQNYGTTITVQNPERSGYSFTGWTFSGDGEFNSETSVLTFGAGTASLTANWDRIVPQTAGLSILGSSPRVIEPWGIRFAMQVSSSFELENADDYGMIVIPEEDYNALENSDINIVRNAQNARMFASSDLSRDGAYYVATYCGGIFTYQLDKSYKVIPFAVYDDTYVAGTLYTDSMMNVVGRAHDKGTLSQKVCTVLEDMQQMHELTVACYSALNITEVHNADLSNVVMGSSEKIGTEVTDSSITARIIGGSPRTCEPWGIAFAAAFKGVEDAADYGIIIVKASEYENRANNMSLLQNENSYIFSNNRGTLKVDGTNRVAVFEGIIQTYTMDDVYYAVPYTEVSENNYVFGTAASRSMMGLVNSVINLGGFSAETTALLNCMVRFNAHVKIAMQ